MPELPEVETIRRQLAPALEGRRLVRVHVLDPRWCEPAPPEAIADALGGRRVERLWRRGKYLVMSTDDDIHLAMHLRMTGNMLLVPPKDDDPDRPHLRVRLHGEPAETDYGLREFALVDPDGNLVRIGSPVGR